MHIHQFFYCQYKTKIFLIILMNYIEFIKIIAYNISIRRYMND